MSDEKLDTWFGCALTELGMKCPLSFLTTNMAELPAQNVSVHTLHERGKTSLRAHKKKIKLNK